MATVQRANVILQISDDQDVIQRYRDKGFDVIDKDTGKVINRAVLHEPSALKARIMELEAELKAREEEIAGLKAKLTQTKQAPTKQTKKSAKSPE